MKLTNNDWTQLVTGVVLLSIGAIIEWRIALASLAIALYRVFSNRRV